MCGRGRRAAGRGGDLREGLDQGEVVVEEPTLAGEQIRMKAAQGEGGGRLVLVGAQDGGGEERQFARADVAEVLDEGVLLGRFRAGAFGALQLHMLAPELVAAIAIEADDGGLAVART